MQFELILGGGYILLELSYPCLNLGKIDNHLVELLPPVNSLGDFVDPGINGRKGIETGYGLQVWPQLPDNIFTVLSKDSEFSVKVFITELAGIQGIDHRSDDIEHGLELSDLLVDISKLLLELGVGFGAPLGYGVYHSLEVRGQRIRSQAQQGHAHIRLQSAQIRVEPFIADILQCLQNTEDGIHRGAVTHGLGEIGQDRGVLTHTQQARDRSSHILAKQVTVGFQGARCRIHLLIGRHSQQVFYRNDSFLPEGSVSLHILQLQVIGQVVALMQNDLILEIDHIALQAGDILGDIVVELGQVEEEGAQLLVCELSQIHLGEGGNVGHF